MLPQWAIQIAAYTRRDIVKSIKACDFDSMYYDTDSNKIMNYSEHKAWFEEFNRQRRELNMQANTFEYDKKYFERIGDHAVNIAEWVTFSITGQREGVE